MKSVVLSVFFVTCYVSTTLAALALGPAQVHPSHPDQCYQESKNEFHKPGDSWTEDGCMEASCVMLNHTGIPRLLISYATCGAVGVDPPCYLTENKALSYPDCCPEPVCPDSTEQSQETPTETTSDNIKKNKNNNNDNDNDNDNNNKEIYHERNDSENELPEDHSRSNSNEYFRNDPWADDFLMYNDQDHNMDNDVDNYLDYYQNEMNPSPRQVFTSPRQVYTSPRQVFTRHDFNIRNFRWY